MINDLDVRFQASQSSAGNEVHIFKFSFTQSLSCLAGEAIGPLVALHIALLIVVLLQKKVIAIVQSIRFCVKGIELAAAQREECTRQSSPHTFELWRCDGGKATGAFCISGFVQDVLFQIMKISEVHPTVFQHLPQSRVRGFHSTCCDQFLEDAAGHPTEEDLHATPGGFVHGGLHLLRSGCIDVDDSCEAQDAIFQSSLCIIRCCFKRMGDVICRSEEQLSLQEEQDDPVTLFA
mmetsp:Transcript_12088/g.20771  ORF Transcript_12088/g.20771 Transcript_12088/m.20771 type:complete len:235 (-) Transcript_12088:1340-2044(-)